MKAVFQCNDFAAYCCHVLGLGGKVVPQCKSERKVHTMGSRRAGGKIRPNVPFFLWMCSECVFLGHLVPVVMSYKPIQELCDRLKIQMQLYKGASQDLIFLVLSS